VVTFSYGRVLILWLNFQALYVINNVVSGSEVHKEAVMTSILSSQFTNKTSWLTRFLQDMSNPQLRVVAVWCIINLLYPVGEDISSRVVRLREAGVEAQLHKMVDDSCLDVKVNTFYQPLTQGIVHSC
jgi:hypothetical protein